jgi:uncharacterized protein (TIGR03000 family)
MYSLVLMMAMGTGSDATAFGRHGCHGCNGGYAGCNGGYSGCSGGYSGCSGNCHGGRRLFGGRHGCNGGGRCHGGGGCCGGYSSGCCGGMSHGPAGCSGAPQMPMGPGEPARPRENVPPPKPRPSGTEEARLPAPAVLRVNLPPDAILRVDDAQTASTSASRVFVSPELPPEKTFHYTLKADIVRDGRTLTSTKEVAVKGGQETLVTMDFPSMNTAPR